MYLISLCMLHVIVILKIFSFMLFLNSELRPHSFSDHPELITAAESQVRAGVQVSWPTESFSCSSFFIWITAGAEIQCHTFTSPFQPWEQDPSKLFNSVKCKPSPLLNYLSHMSHARCIHRGRCRKRWASTYHGWWLGFVLHELHFGVMGFNRFRLDSVIMVTLEIRGFYSSMNG